LLEYFVNFYLLDGLFAAGASFISASFPGVKTEFAENLIAFIASMTIKN